MGDLNLGIDIAKLKKSAGGGGGGGGLTIDPIFTGSVVKGSSTAYTFTAPYTDYKILIFTTASGVNTECGNPMVVASSMKQIILTQPDIPVLRD